MSSCLNHSKIQRSETIYEGIQDGQQLIGEVLIFALLFSQPFKSNRLYPKGPRMALIQASFCRNLPRSQAMPLTIAWLRRLLIKMFVANGRFRATRSPSLFQLGWLKFFGGRLALGLVPAHKSMVGCRNAVGRCDASLCPGCSCYS
jgi:hypothetical protein